MGGRVAGARASAGGLLGGRQGGQSERLLGASRRGPARHRTGLGAVPRALSDRPRRLPHCSASRSCRIWGTLGTPLSLPSLLCSPFSFSSPFLVPPSPFYSSILLGVPSRGPVASPSTMILGQWLAQVVEGWSGHDRRSLSLAATVAAAEAAAGEAAARRRQLQNWSVI